MFAFFAITIVLVGGACGEGEPTSSSPPGGGANEESKANVVNVNMNGTPAVIDIPPKCEPATSTDGNPIPGGLSVSPDNTSAQAKETGDDYHVSVGPNGQVFEVFFIHQGQDVSSGGDFGATYSVSGKTYTVSGSNATLVALPGSSGPNRTSDQLPIRDKIHVSLRAA